MAATAAALGLVAFTPLGAALAGLAETAARVAPVWARASVSLFCFVASIGLALAAVAVAAGRLAGGARTRESDRRLPSAIALATDAQSLFAGLAALLFCAAVVQVSVWAAGGWWWLTAGIGIATGLLLAAHVTPAFVSVLSGARPIASPSLASRLRALAEQAGVPLDRVDEIPVHETDEATAFVAGLKGRRRIFLASTLVRDWLEEEVAVVVAHELGHHHRGDLWRTLALDAALLVAGLGAAGLLATPHSDAGSLAALPAVAWVAWVVWVAATPIRNAQSRRHELLADAFALSLTGSSDAFATVVRRLGARHLADERPSTLTRWFTFRHPTVPERLAAARAHAAAHDRAGREARTAVP